MINADMPDNIQNDIVESTSELAKKFDWTRTSLGGMDTWPGTLCTMFSLCIHSKSPVLILWGEDLVQIYNDAYRDILGNKHPHAFGSRAKDDWKNYWTVFGPLLEDVLQNGNSHYHYNQPLIINRKGYPESCYFTFSYTPIFEGTAVAGIFVQALETTEINIKMLNLRKLRDKQLKNLFTQASIGMCMLTGSQFLVESANERMLEIWGKSADAVLNQPLFEAVPDAGGHGYQALLNKVLTTGERVVVDEKPLRLVKNGVVNNFFVKFVYEPLLEEDGTITGIMVLADEVTDQVAARQKIEESEMRLRIAIDAAEIGTFDWDLVNSSFEFSDKMAAIFGFQTTENPTHKNFIERIHPDDQSKRAAAHQLAFQSGSLHYEVRLQWPDKSVHWIRLNGKVFYDHDGKPVRVYGTVLDISESILQEDRLEKLLMHRTSSLHEKNEALKRSEERYHKMVEEVQEYAIILLDENGIIQNWNKGAEKIKQYTEKEAVGRPFQIFYLPQDRAVKLPEKLINEAITTGRASHEGWRLRKDQTRFWGSITITALHDDQGKIIGFSKVTRDLTERKAAEDRLRSYALELEIQNKELEQFAFVASHDLQEPLRKIQTFTDLVLKNFHDEPQARNFLMKITSAAQRMSDLIRSVLNYSRLANRKDEPVPTDLNLVLSNVQADFELLIQEKKAKIISDPLPVINAVPLQISQLLANLISNSLKFSEAFPVINITSREVSREQIVNRPDFLKANAYLEISIADNGIGFDQQYERKIFTMFQRLHGTHKYAGTGIGLALCQKIMENHHGFITAKSELGKGSVFYIYFPR